MHKVVQLTAGMRENHKGVLDSRMGGSDDYGDRRVRIHAYKFGDHLRARTGVLVMVATAEDANLDVVKGSAVRALYGDEAALDLVDWNSVQLFLLPSGEEITSPSECFGKRLFAKG